MLAPGHDLARLPQQTTPLPHRERRYLPPDTIGRARYTDVKHDVPVDPPVIQLGCEYLANPSAKPAEIDTAALERDAVERHLRDPAEAHEDLTTVQRNDQPDRARRILSAGRHGAQLALGASGVLRAAANS